MMLTKMKKILIALLILSSFCTIAQDNLEENLEIQLSEPVATEITTDEGFVNVFIKDEQVFVSKYNNLGNEEWNISFISGWANEENRNEITYSIELTDDNG